MSVSLVALVDEQLALAAAAPHGRSAHTVFGGSGHALRQTLLALGEGAGLAEHDSPGDATLQVLRGHIVLVAGGVSQHGQAGDLLVIPPERHAVQALAPSAVLLTVAKP